MKKKSKPAKKVKDELRDNLLSAKILIEGGREEEARVFLGKKEGDVFELFDLGLKELRKTGKKRKKISLQLMGLLGLIFGLIIFLGGAWVYKIQRSGHGLRGEYYTADINGKRKAFLGAKENYQIDFNWREGEIYKGHKDYVWIKFDGYINAPEEGLYYFTVRSDDGVRLKLNSNTIIDELSDIKYLAEYKRGKVELNKGWNLIQLWYLELTGSAKLNLYWSPPGRPEHIVHWSSLKLNRDVSLL